MKNYLFILGRNRALSKAEISVFADEVLFDEQEGLFLAENVRFTNPRDLPKSPEQVLLDRLGGVIRFGEVLGEFGSKQALIEKIREFFSELNRDGTQYVGVSSFGTGRQFLSEFLSAVRKDLEQNLSQKVRIENREQKNLSSADIFNAKLLKKGAEFLIWQRRGSFLLARTVANQNLRNYELRDGSKVFRDAHMGMLPPRLAQILANLATEKSADFLATVIDPFCGSGTVNAEVALMGYSTVGSDINGKFLEGAQKNFEFLAEKFRYDSGSGDFFTANAEEFPWDKHAGVVATEGWLGKNFNTTPSLTEIEENKTKVEKMWINFFTNLAKKSAQKVPRVVFCLPCWQHKGKSLSISKKIFAKIAALGYAPAALFDGSYTCLYARPDAFVAREVCVVDLQK